MLYDITPPVNESLKVWPGDTAPSREILSEVGGGASVTLSTLRTTVHLGAHADAPSHCSASAPSIDEVSLDPYLGPCRVVRVDVPRGSCLTLNHWQQSTGGRGLQAGSDNADGRSTQPRRILFATGTYPNPFDFNEDFAALSPELVDHLHECGVRLVGIDTPSVDLFSSKELPAHNRCLQLGMAVLEGLVLADVPEGLYELIALPLKLVGFDASPVRAVLRGMQNGNEGF